MEVLMTLHVAFLDVSTIIKIKKPKVAVEISPAKKREDFKK